MEDFIPISKQDMLDRGWYYYDFLLVTGDSYVDHPSFGVAVIARVLESAGYRCAILSQPDWHSAADFAAMGKPRYAVMITAGNIDSMVAHYSVFKKKRRTDYYTAGNLAGKRPDRASIVYSNRAREAFPDTPVILGGLEASLRRFAHYDYWDDAVRRSVLVDAGADLLIYGMGELASLELAEKFRAGLPVSAMTDIRGTCFLADGPEDCRFPSVFCAGFDESRTDKRAYAQANILQYREHDAVTGRAVLQPHGKKLLVCNPPQPPLTTAQMDRFAELPYQRRAHPVYDALGGVPAIEEVRFSVIHNRGCFGACNFCSLAFHQGRTVSTRSHESLEREVRQITQMPDFKGYIHDVGGPTANFRAPSCRKQLKSGMCRERACLAPDPCPNLQVDHTDYLKLLRRLRSVEGIKKVFIRSGIRFDYLMLDKNGEFFHELVKYHISGQLKVAPEHCANAVLYYMGKSRFDVYERFEARFQKLTQRIGKEQYLVPYLMSSHPGCTLQDAVRLAEYLHRTGRHPQQVQDFYPTPGTLSTCMYYTGLDPRTMKPVYVAKTPREKAQQRALLQWNRPEKRPLLIDALKAAGREDLIGFGKHCLIRPPTPAKAMTHTARGRKDAARHGRQGKDPSGRRK